MQVSVRELKTHLSKYLHMVEGGETVIITSHHTPVAQILPVPQHENKGLQRLMQLGIVKWNGKKPQGGKTMPVITGKTLSDIVLEDRE